jgi:hypothetical protein
MTLLILARHRGQPRSVQIGGVSHWFARVAGHDIDLTGDQFGRPPVVIRPAPIWVDSRARSLADVAPETWLRALQLERLL